MERIPMELYECKVDYITASVMLDKVESRDQIDGAIMLANEIQWAERRKGNDALPFRLKSFDGVTVGQSSIGESSNGLLFRLSGDAASDHWFRVHELATNVSRIDVAATVRLTDGWRDLSQVYEWHARQYAREHSPKLRVTRIDGGKHGRSLMIGSRSSDAYGRIYDKHAESKDKFYEDCWRFEVEFKRSLALRVADQLAEDDGLTSPPSGVALGWFGRRGSGPAGLTLDCPLRRGSLKTTTDERRLRWLASAVAGSVKKLVESGRRDDVLKALKLSRAV